MRRNRVGLRAHDLMGKRRTNLADEDVKRAAAAADQMTVVPLARFATTRAQDREDRPAEHGAELAADLSRLDDDGGPTVGV